MTEFTLVAGIPLEKRHLEKDPFSIHHYYESLETLYTFGFPASLVLNLDEPRH
jgi:hypothetical protein